jgi:hypothetical protein
MDHRLSTALLLFAWCVLILPCRAEPLINHDPEKRQLVLANEAGLRLRLSYGERCTIDELTVAGREVIRPGSGTASGLKIGDRWFTSQDSIWSPVVHVSSNTVNMTGIAFGNTHIPVSETWHFTVRPDAVVWRIDREYESSGTAEDVSLPKFEFENMSTWTGALLGHGGVAWGKLFDAPNASYGVHNGNLTFWHKNHDRCLRVRASSPSGGKVAVRFSREPSGAFSCNFSVSDNELSTRHGLSRFRSDRHDIWAPFEAARGRVSVEITLSAPRYGEAYDRGTLAGVDGGAIREICHTIARIGAIDELIIGSNGYYSGYAVLHEPWLAQLGLAIADPEYHRAFGETLEFQRQHAIGPDGRVKSRWAGQRGDEIPGTYDPFGFYECQWGWLMDSQTSWVINVAEQFDFTGDLPWLQRQKAAVRTALEYLLRRDGDADGLVEMMTDSHRDAKGSDWIDVVWAAHENALVNAQLFWGLSRWADLEELLGERVQAETYRRAANKLKAQFNQSTADGGFWDASAQCYAYWREKDGSIHGTNLVVPVQFSAIGYGLCDDPGRRGALLDGMEERMRAEGLFFWPLCFTSFAKEEGHPQVNWPFPQYENGDIFLAWGELGTRAYARHQPAIALKYVKNVLAQYNKDGLSFQRYRRLSQTGAGDDILGNNCSVVVGLYRNIYGVQPKHDRLYLEPHITPELNGTQFTYRLRGQDYRISLNEGDYAVAVDKFTVRSRQPFAIASDGRAHRYFNRQEGAPALTVIPATADAVRLTIHSWPELGHGARAWSQSGLQPGTAVGHVISGLTPSSSYQLKTAGQPSRRLQSGAAGQITFEVKVPPSGTHNLELEPTQ